ncbi:ligand-binding sensor domain-containing protein/signal transduction histidine kinase/DNA-binding response OmpR family regulator [Parabacteroides sp. PFB2-10]|uniref:hybrid sensor histidine kinase/response regulator transcription factor n=1 Tax=Parabacteroides sp. PFB2-10 TaxID=1742405 RepID=UPI002473DF88|nr:hybrid sensor histidine kinase/response regulator transcription factor [Parabacteroides sp. PFB2-10]MDH6314110.1 ligand-binding sensor domain-containing protein/signal transduction histidine kinase/DNA-binding response OmpR family regulator [Parabacteroides sp. PFB2-10]
MKGICCSCSKYLYVFFFLSNLFIVSGSAYAESYKFNHITIEDGLPSSEIYQIYQDKEGYMWFATRNGLCQYDGYSIRTYKSNLYTPELLTNNTIYCVAEDNDSRLWIGTYSGLNVLHKKTGMLQQITHEMLLGRWISKLLITKNGDLILGTENGVFRYNPETEECSLINSSGGVKALIQDSHDFIWIGTWSSGIFRYDLAENKTYSYPSFTPNNSCYSLYEDQRKRIWVGTWDAGLFVIRNPYDMDNLQVKGYSHDQSMSSSIADNYIYEISEDLNTGMIWVGTRNGLSILIDENEGRFQTILPDNSKNSISFKTISSLLRDKEGTIWIGTMGGGVNSTWTRKSEFNSNNLEEVKHEYISTSSVRDIMVDQNGLIWIALDNRGFLLYNRITGKYTYNTDSPDFHEFGRLPTINTIKQSPTTGKIWIGTFDWGLYQYDEKAPAGQRVKLYNRTTAPWMSNQCVFTIQEDSRQLTWLGFRNGLMVVTPQDEGISLNDAKIRSTSFYSFSFVDITEDEDGGIWAATSNGGIVRIIGDPREKEDLHIQEYSPENKKLNNSFATCLFIDKQKRLWAGTEGGGLSLYNKETDSFLPVHQRLNLPGDDIFSIQEDTKGNLWIGSNVGLIKLQIPHNTDSAKYSLYTSSDGLQDNLFNRNAAFTDINGEMFFGGHFGYNSFFPDRMSEENTFPPIVITDIKIFNKPWGQLDPKEQNTISSYAPGFTDKIKLDYNKNNFEIEFAALGYAASSHIKYAYKLEGFDMDWQYTDASRRFAYYNNLKTGNYTFSLKNTNANGSWNDSVKQLQVTILPPPWETAWAYLLYVLLIVLAVYGGYRFVRYRIKLTQSLQLAELEQAKRDEVNHSKLQFFTNITHELLTPLTIISASVDELKQTAPENKEQYRVMTSNVNRLIRLLQQILEFRKAETGNLKLKVSQGDLAGFVRNSVESFKPLIKKQRMHFSLICDPEYFPAYFDPDKLDKILYNLLSNAAKYNTPGAAVWIDLQYDTENGWAVLSVKDNGKGMSKETVNNLFKRFYEGDHRKFKTAGTGIGLSLTKDLVLLHKGNIEVNSEPGKGSEFKVIIPIRKSFYSPEEIDDSISIPDSETSYSLPNKVVKESDTIEQPPREHTILLIEDNDDLLQLMVRLLSLDFIVHTAKTGTEGIRCMENEEIDLVVSDIMMPEMDGITFCKQVKNNLETSHIPIILLTAKNREEDRVEAYESGADGFITKPFNLSVLHARINNLIKAKERNTHDFKKQLTFEANELNYTSLDEEFLQRAIDLIHEHLDDPEFDQVMFQEAMGTSRSTLYRKLKSLTGLNPSSFIRNIRIKAACRIMEEKRNLRISEVAYAVGFNDPKYFSACFKKEMGMLASEYMERFVPDSLLNEKTN